MRFTVSTDSPSPGVRRVAHIMGMPIGVDVRDPEIDPGALDRAFAWLRWVDATFSTYKPDSEISRLNRGDLALRDVHPDVRAILARCAALRLETGGYFDSEAALLAQWERVGDVALRLGAVDPSGLVKGWAVERAARLLEGAGARNYSVNAGGDIRVRGCPSPTSGWRIGIQHPTLRDKMAAVIEATDVAIATSGAYERGAHIVDPHTGRPPDGVLSVTIVGPDLATADAYATAAYAMGQEGPAWTARLVARGYEAMTILADQTVLSTPAFPTL
ncbi:MAG: FAD:protein FMN transferase [Chloroflexota bacterium]|nr:FAD:protein FMN transferase [Chloroflexota bacterium]